MTDGCDLTTLIALGQLTEYQREIFIDHALVGISVRALSAREGVPSSSITRALEQARVRLTAWGDRRRAEEQTA